MTKPGQTRFFLALLLITAVLGGCAAPLRTLPRGTFAFGLLGDTPYSDAEVRRLDAVIEDMNSHGLAFVVHLGDVGTSQQACRDAWLDARKSQFSRVRHPFLLLPGDNEWTDCAVLGIDPMERLARWRERFCTRRLGALKLAVQNGPYCEHVRWESGNHVFVTLNVPGNHNNFRHPEHEARMKAVHAWLEEAATRAGEQSSLVVLMQANPFVTFPVDGYRALREQLERLASRRPGRIYLVHGDTHLYRNDEPRPGLRRIEVWGSPFVRWLRGSVLGGEIAVEQAAAP